jgi:nucleoside-diphosphate-sugar epimerase
MSRGRRRMAPSPPSLQKIMTHGNTALILGATGGIGGEIARQMRDGGWDVRALNRRAAQPVEHRDGITWIQGDALDQASVRAAARDASVIVHAVNPPGYRNWSKVVLPMLDNTIAAATPTGAMIVLPGTVYNYGPDAFPLLTEDAPQRPVTRKGAIRVEMERRLRAYADHGGRVLIVRAGDFFGPKLAGSSWFSQGLVKAGHRVTRIYDPGRRGVGHQWSYVPDVARTVLELLQRREALEPCANFHVAGHWDADGTQMIHAIRRIVARRTGVEPRITAFPWWLLTLCSPFVPLFREMGEMRYLWREPLRMDNSRLLAVLGREPHTPLESAVDATLQGLGCLDVASVSPALQR